MTLDALALFPRQLEAHYLAIPAGFEHWAPPAWDGIPSEPFTAIEQVCHVRDVEIDGYHVRFQRTLHESDPLLRRYPPHDATTPMRMPPPRLPALPRHAPGRSRCSRV